MPLVGVLFSICKKVLHMEKPLMLAKIEGRRSAVLFPGVKCGSLKPCRDRREGLGLDIDVSWTIKKAEH